MQSVTIFHLDVHFDIEGGKLGIALICASLHDLNMSVKYIGWS